MFWKEERNDFVYCAYFFLRMASARSNKTNRDAERIERFNSDQMENSEACE